MEINIRDRSLVSFTRSLYIRFIILFILALIYYLNNWTSSIMILGNILSWMYNQIAGISTSYIHPYFSGILYKKTFLTKACLYYELYVYILPFLYDKSKSAIKNVVYILTVLVVIQIINIIRIFVSVIWRISYDVPRWLHHDLPDYVIWFSICIGLMVYGALKHEPISIKVKKLNMGKE